MRGGGQGEESQALILILLHPRQALAEVIPGAVEAGLDGFGGAGQNGPDFGMGQALVLGEDEGRAQFFRQGLDRCAHLDGSLLSDQPLAR